MKYAIKVGFHVKEAAEVVGSELERIRQKNGGRLKPEMVVKEARPKRARLHSLFEWDDAAAAKSYRIQQANYLIRSVVVVAEKEKSEDFRPVRAFVSLVDGVEGGPGPSYYTSIEDALADPITRERLLEKARNEVLQWRDRYRALNEFTELFELVDKIAV